MQAGTVTILNSESSKVVTLPVAMPDSNYYVALTVADTAIDSATQFIAYPPGNHGSYTIVFHWIAVHN